MRFESARAPAPLPSLHPPPPPSSQGEDVSIFYANPSQLSWQMLLSSANAPTSTLSSFVKMCIWDVLCHAIEQYAVNSTDNIVIAKTVVLLRVPYAGHISLIWKSMGVMGEGLPGLAGMMTQVQTLVVDFYLSERHNPPQSSATGSFRTGIAMDNEIL